MTIVFTPGEARIIKQANTIMERKFRSYELKVRSPGDIKLYLRNKLAGEQRQEVFCAMWLTTRHHLIDFQELFRGTIDGAAVYPRDVVRAALEHGASAVIFAHNHPSGDPTPSQADKVLTEKLKEALETIEIRVLDHIVVALEDQVSMAERGLL